MGLVPIMITAEAICVMVLANISNGPTMGILAASYFLWMVNQWFQREDPMFSIDVHFHVYADNVTAPSSAEPGDVTPPGISFWHQPEIDVAAEI